MRIGLVTTEFVSEPFFDGGLANYIFRLAISLIKLDHTPIIIVTSDFNEVINFKGIEVHRVDAVFKQKHIPWNITLIQMINRAFSYLNMSFQINKYIRRLHNQNPFDIIQYTHLMGLGMFRIKTIPSIIRLSSHTPSAMEAHGVKNFRRQQYIWEKIAMRRTDGIFGPSQMICSIVSKELRRPVKMIESPFINDIEVEDNLVYENYLLNKKYLLFFGTIELLKGVGTIGRTLRKIFSKHSMIYFVFIGKDNGLPDGKPLVPQLFVMAGEYKDKVIYLDKLHHEQLYPIIKNSIAVVLPSRIENFSNACIESMAHKRIVIGTRGTSFEQLIEDGKSGFLCEVDDEKSLLNAVNKVMNLSQKERDQIGQKAWERIQELHPNIVVNKLLEYYAEIIKKKQDRKQREG